MSLWNSVCKTNPAHTKPANIGGMNITAIAPMYQIQMATEQFGPYGSSWGLKNIKRDFQLVPDLSLVIFEGVFFYPGGEFEISTSAGIYRDNANTKIDKDFCKKMETDLLTKALSKIGFNADVFMGRFDDVRYVSEMQKEFNKPVLITRDQGDQIIAYLKAKQLASDYVLDSWNIKKLSELHQENFQNMMDWIEGHKDPKPEVETVEEVAADVIEKKPDGTIITNGVITCHPPRTAKTEEEQAQHIEFMRRANEFRKEEKAALQKQRYKNRVNADITDIPNDRFEQPQQEQKAMNRAQYLKSVADDVRKKRADDAEAAKKIHLSGQVLSPTQFASINEMLRRLESVDPQYTPQWLAEKMGVDSIGHIDSAYYPGMMKRLGDLGYRSGASSGEKTQYQRRTELLKRISEAA